MKEFLDFLQGLSLNDYLLAILLICVAITMSLYVKYKMMLFKEKKEQQNR